MKEKLNKEGVFMKNFINPDELDQLDNVILIDVRQDLQDPTFGPKAYATEHLNNAFYLSLEEDLTGEITENTGSHPLPSQDQIKKRLEEMGANNESVFVFYDEGSNFTAPRGWFILKYFGLEKVFVLNGGFPAAVNYGYKTSQEVPKAQKSYIELSANQELLASYDGIVEYAKKPNDEMVLIDSRSAERYRGEVEHLYDKAGHIPNAVNYFYGDNYTDEGIKKSEEELKERFSDLTKKQDIVVSCGSGVTACANYIVLDEVGFEPRLYNGSYSLWLKKGNTVD